MAVTELYVQARDFGVSAFFVSSFTKAHAVRAVNVLGALSDGPPPWRLFSAQGVGGSTPVAPAVFGLVAFRGNSYALITTK